MSKVQEFIINGDFIPVTKTNSDPTYTAAKGDIILVDTSGGTVTVNLPASPAVGDRVVFLDSKQNWGTNNLTVGRNGSNIDGAGSDHTGDDTEEIIEFIYSGDATVGWMNRTFGGGVSVGGYSSGDYGYNAGGANTGGSISSIESMQFPFDSGTASVVNTLSAATQTPAGCNSSNYGFAMGGYSTSNLSSIERIDFPFNTGTGVIKGNLTAGKNNLYGINSSNYGYCIGGWASGEISAIDGFQFPFDSGNASQSGNLNYSSTNSAGCNSSTHGYRMGGGNTYGTGQGYAAVERMTFAITGTATITGNLSVSSLGNSCCNSSEYGFAMGGYRWEQSTIDRITFPFNSGTASHVGNLTISSFYVSGVNSSTHGYNLGGHTISVNEFSNVDRITFPFNSGTATHVGNLSKSIYYTAGIDETDFNTLFI